ncbi:MAG: ATP-binding protein [Clostridiales bacterium]|nr:ATP-binding protein [Clostridiales bacterium]
MLKLFEVTGFKNLENKLRLDFSDVHSYTFNDACISGGLLKNIIVYGKNAEGKTNLGIALFDIALHLTSYHKPYIFDDHFYLNANNLMPYVEFHYVFEFSTKKVDYLYRKDKNQTLIYEAVSIDDVLLFAFDYLDQQKSNLIGLKKLLPLLNLEFRGKVSLLRYAVVNSILPEDHPLYLMYRFVSRMLWFQGSDLARFNYMGYTEDTDNYEQFVINYKLLEEFESFIHQAGIQKHIVEKKQEYGLKYLYFDEQVPLPFFKVASNGTLALHTFFYWYKSAVELSLLFIDDFDAFYHFEFAETIVKILEKSNFQTILTSHNTNLLSNRILRPDCYFILSQGKLTSFANSTDRTLQESHDIENLYISGEFDAYE